MSTEAATRLNGTGYAAETVTKPPDWHGLVSWVHVGRESGLSDRTGSLSDRPGVPGLRSGRSASFPPYAEGLQADLAHVAGDLVSDHLYSLPLTVAVGLSLWPVEGPVLELARRTAVVLGLLPALGSAIYKGVLLSTNSQPGWALVLSRTPL